MTFKNLEGVNARIARRLDKPWLKPAVTTAIAEAARVPDPTAPAAVSPVAPVAPVDDPHDAWSIGAIWGWHARAWLAENPDFLEKVGNLLDGDAADTPDT